MESQMRSGGRPHDAGAEWRLARRQRQRHARRRRRQLAAGAGLVLAIAAVVAIVAIAGGSKGGSAAHRSTTAAQRAGPSRRTGPPSRHRGSHAGHGSEGALAPGVPAAARDVSAPVLMYHVINPPPAGAPFPGLYVPAPEFAQPMQE